MLKAKLVIWDLDETLWDGTLAEGDDIAFRSRRVEAIRALNACGVVNSICSKNDLDSARAALENQGLWDEFVFPEIAFTPKGKSVKRILSDMNLRASDAVFIDDNELNRREVEFENPGITTVDALGEAVDALLQAILRAHAGSKKSRVAEYRMLEKKRGERATFASNEDFLRTCDIHIGLLRRSDNLPHAARIEELINRTNQLNFTKSRVENGSLATNLIDPRFESYGVFVWDRFGYHGLVGFAATYRKKLVHFLFSCRIMNMGIEAAVASAISGQLADQSIFPVAPFKASWITFVDSSDETFRSLVSTSSPRGQAYVHVMANCQSGAIAHFLGQDGIEWDNWPRIFTLSSALDAGATMPALPQLIYGAFNDYDPRYWPSKVLPSAADYELAARAFLDRLSLDTSLIILLPPEPEHLPLYAQYNHVWRAVGKVDPRVTPLAMPIDGPKDDPRHFTASELAAVAKLIEPLLRRQPASRDNDQPVPNFLG